MTRSKPDGPPFLELLSHQSPAADVGFVAVERLGPEQLREAKAKHVGNIASLRRKALQSQSAQGNARRRELPSIPAAPRPRIGRSGLQRTVKDVSDGQFPTNEVQP